MEDVIVSFVKLIFSVLDFVIAVLCLPFSFFPSKKFQPSVVLITGASSGIGATLAMRYASMKKGMVIIITGRNKEKLEVIAEQCRGLGAIVEILVVDVCDKEGMTKLLQEADNKHPIDLVIANAGISGGILGEIPWEEKVSPIISTNLLGVVNTLTPLLSRLIDRKRGQIGVVSSLSGFYDLPRSLAYSSSKDSLLVLCRSLRGVLSPYNVGVTVICPGYVHTKFTASSHAQGRATPFLITPERACEIIVEGLERGKPVIAFPLQMYALTYGLRSVSPGVHDWLATLFGLHSKKLDWKRMG